MSLVWKLGLFFQRGAPSLVIAHKTG